MARASVGGRMHQAQKRGYGIQRSFIIQHRHQTIIIECYVPARFLSVLPLWVDCRIERFNHEIKDSNSIEHNVLVHRLIQDFRDRDGNVKAVYDC